MSWFSIRSPAVCSVWAFGPLTWKPSSCATSASWSDAIRSISPAFSASSAVRFFALVTSSLARRGFRPWIEASARIEAAASFLILRSRSLLPPSGPTAIGVAEPMFVSGAIAATSAASVM